MESLTVMIVDSGGRAHAISNAYEKSPHVRNIIVTPGNDFIKYNREKNVITAKSSLMDSESIAQVAHKYKPDIIDVAQDDALANGTVDLLNGYGFQTFGTSRKASRIEWDKNWSRKFMKKYEIPHPRYKKFSTDESIDYVKRIYSENENALIYVKAAGLCAGKGALKSKNVYEAIGNIRKMKTFPNFAGRNYLIEEGLEGEEFSLHAITDGTNYRLFKSAQDNKTVFNHDKGKQTGGMGAISPFSLADEISDEIEKHHISKAIEGMKSEGINYNGILYLGGIIVNGKPVNIEFNSRFGDPESQVILPSLETDYLELVDSCNLDISQDKKTRVCVVGTSKGYPDDYSDVIGKRIVGIKDVMKMKNITILGAGIKVEDGKHYVNGGRVFNTVAEGNDIVEAFDAAYNAMDFIRIEGNNLHYRTDIGGKEVEKFLSSI